MAKEEPPDEKLLGTGIKLSDPNEWQFTILIGKEIKGALKSRGWKAGRVAAYMRGDGALVIKRL
jgi:hypothetical protein